MRRRALSIWPLTTLLALAGAACGGNPTAPSQSLMIACPAPQTTQSATGQGVVVNYTAASASGGTPPITVTCSPSSGSTFPIGTTTVRCTASDAARATASCSFPVMVVSPPRLAFTRFSAFGDSLTEGKLANGTLTPNSYPAVLQRSLTARYTAQQSAIVVVNDGKSGEKIVSSDFQDGLHRLPITLVTDQAQVLLLMEGANDLSVGDPAVIMPAIDGLRTMVRQARGQNVQVFLSTLPPERAGGQRTLGSYPLVPAFNDQVRFAAGAEGATLVDVFQAFGGTPDPYVGDDGLHLTEDGYQRLAQIYFDAIRTKFETTSVDTVFGFRSPSHAVVRRR